MTPNLVLINGLQTTLSGNVSTASTSIIVASAANIPSISAGQILPLTIISASSQSTFEIVYATAISGTTLTVTRAQEGTAAGTFTVGDFVECSPTAQTVGLTGIQTLQVSANTTVTPSFTRTVILTPSLTANITVTVNAGNILGQKVIIYGSPAAFAVTINSSVSSGSPYFEFVDGSNGYVWAHAPSNSGSYIELTWDGSNWSAETAGHRVCLPAQSSNQTINLGQGQSVFAAKNGNAANLFSAANATGGNQVTTFQQVMMDNGALTGVDCNTLVNPGQYLLVSPVNWVPTGFSSGMLLVVRKNNEILQITSDFGNAGLWWRSAQYVTNSGFPAGTPWRSVLSSNNLFSNINVCANGTNQPSVSTRQANVVYTNTSGRQIMVMINASTAVSTGNVSAPTIRFFINSTLVGQQYLGGTSSTIVSANFYVPVPNGSTYEFVYGLATATQPISLFWTEIY